MSESQTGLLEVPANPIPGIVNPPSHCEYSIFTLKCNGARLGMASFLGVEGLFIWG